MYVTIIAAQDMLFSVNEIPVYAGNPIPCHLCGRTFKWVRLSGSYACIHPDDAIWLGLGPIPIIPMSTVPVEKVIVEQPCDMFTFILMEADYVRKNKPNVLSNFARTFLRRIRQGQIERLRDGNLNLGAE